MYRGGRGRGGGPRGRGRGRGRGRPHDGPARMGRSPPRRRRTPEPDSRDNHYCIFCKIQLTSKKAFDEHKAGAVHKQKEILIQKAVTDGLHYCYTCEKIFPSKVELDAHCLMSRHQPLYRVEGLQDQLEPQEEPEPPKTENEKRRAEDEKDRQKIVMKLNELKEDSPDRNKRNFCTVCSIDCVSDSNYKAHLDSWRHRAELDKKKEAETKKQIEEEFERKFKEIDGQNDNDVDMNDESKIQVPSHLSSVASRVWCELCGVGMNDEDAYMQHLRGRKHLRVVSQMKRPYKCYVCNMTFTVEKEFNHHLQSRSHMDKAFRGQKGGSSSGGKDSSSRRGNRNDARNDRNDRNDRTDRNDKNDNRDRKRQDDPQRKVEIVKSPVDSGDLREKLQGKTNIVITRTNTDSDKKEINQYGPKLPNDSGTKNDKDPTTLNKRAKELEFEAKFRKLVREYGNNMKGLKERLTRDREQDISTYQQYESAYSKLCREEDYVRENIRVLDEGDPRKEEYIRDMIRIQNDMREVRQELEIREMMIIKREGLFREKFGDVDNKVVIKPNSKRTDEDFDKAKKGTKAKEEASTSAKESKKDEGQSDDLRVQLERERLLKRLGPELNSLDPVLRDKLLAAIMDEKKELAKEQASNKAAGKIDSDEKKRQMAMLTEREKELQKELAELKSKSDADSKKKITKSLVPQYDDVDEKKETKKKGRRSRSESSESSDSSSSSSDEDEDDGKTRKRRRRSPSTSNRRNHSKSSDRSSRKRRRRSTSREKDRKRGSSKRSNDSDRSRRSDRKSEKKKPVKMTIKSKESSKVKPTSNPLVIESSDSNDEGNEKQKKQQQPSQVQAPQQQLMTSSQNVIPIIGGGVSASPAPFNQQQQRPFFAEPSPKPVQQIPTQRREQFSLWKNPVIPSQAAQPKESPKEDVWDIAFSGAPKEEQDKDDALSRLFNTNTDSPKTLPDQILDILRTVAPAIQNVANQQQNQQNEMPRPPAPQPVAQPQEQLNQFPVPIPKQAEKPPTAFPSFGRPEYFDTKTPVQIPLVSDPLAPTTTQPAETSGGRIRSILKKMKDPSVSAPTASPAGFNVTSTTPSYSKTSVAETVIPGLDGPVQEAKPVPEPVMKPDTRAPAPVTTSAQQYNQDPYGSRPPSEYPAATSTVTESSYASSRPAYTDQYDRYAPPPATTSTAARQYDDDPYGRPPPQRQSPAPSAERLPARYDAAPPRDYDSRAPPVASYDMDVESYRRREESTGRDSRLPPPATAAPRYDHYGREVLPPPARERDVLPPPRSDEPLVAPVKRPEETEDQFYIRFERYYEEKRRREAEQARRDYPPARRYEDDLHRYPPPPAGDYGARPPYPDRRIDDRYDDRYYQRPPIDERDRLMQHRDRYARDPLPPGRDLPGYGSHDRRGSDPHLPPRPDAHRQSYPEDMRRYPEDDRRRSYPDSRRSYGSDAGRDPSRGRLDDRRPPQADDRRPPPADDRRPPMDGRRPPPIDDRRPPPVDGRRPPPTDDRRPPPADDRRPPPADDRRQPPADARRPPPADDRRPLPTDDRKLPPVDARRLPPADDRRPLPVDGKRPPPADDRRPLPVDGRRPPPADDRRQSPLHGQRPVPVDARRPPPGDDRRPPPAAGQIPPTSAPGDGEKLKNENQPTSTQARSSPVINRGIPLDLNGKSPQPPTARGPPPRGRSDRYHPY